MTDYPPNKFAFWFNCQPESDQDRYWALQDIPVEEIFKLYDYASDEKNHVEGFNGSRSVRVRAKMMPAQAKSGNRYMKMVISDYQPKEESQKEAF